MNAKDVAYTLGDLILTLEDITDDARTSLSDVLVSRLENLVEDLDDAHKSLTDVADAHAREARIERAELAREAELLAMDYERGNATAEQLLSMVQEVAK